MGPSIARPEGWPDQSAPVWSVLASRVAGLRYHLGRRLDRPAPACQTYTPNGGRPCRAVGNHHERVELREAVHDRELVDGNILRRPQSYYLDFDIDGRPLRDWIDQDDDLITALYRPWLPSVEQSIAELTGRCPDPDLPPGRIAVSRCAACGDIECGGLTARLALTEDTVTWSDFSWESDPEDDELLPAFLEVTFVFERSAYEETIEQARRLVGSFPYDPLAHHGRRFLWPWQWGWRLPKS